MQVLVRCGMSRGQEKSHLERPDCTAPVLAPPILGKALKLLTRTSDPHDLAATIH